jgi:FkbM family methyltransferase
MDEWRELQAGRLEARTSLSGAPSKPGAIQAALIAMVRASPLHRGAFRPWLSRLILALGGGRPVDVGFRGAVFRITGARNLIEDGIMLHPRYNEADIAFLEPAARGGVLVDIGSNIGLYSLPLAATASHVIAIDANPRMCDLLALNAALSGIRNVTVVTSAVSDAPGRANLAMRKKDQAIVRIEEDDNGSVPVRTLADILGSLGVTKVDALKIDIEGHEDKALAPFLEAASEADLPSRVVIETAGDGDDYPRCKAAFARRGYRLARRTRQNSLYERGAGD